MERKYILNEETGFFDMEQHLYYKISCGNYDVKDIEHIFSKLRGIELTEDNAFIRIQIELEKEESNGKKLKLDSEQYNDSYVISIDFIEKPLRPGDWVEYTIIIKYPSNICITREEYKYLLQKKTFLLSIAIK